jgi:hypothetical protein
MQMIHTVEYVSGRVQSGCFPLDAAQAVLMVVHAIWRTPPHIENNMIVDYIARACAGFRGSTALSQL